MFPISKCRGDWDLGLCTTSGLANRNAVATSGKKTCFDAGKIVICHCAAVLHTQVPKLCTDLDLGLLYILISGTCSKFAQKHNFLSLGVCFPQLCRFAASRWRLQNYRRIVSFPRQNFRLNTLSTGFHWESAFFREIPNPIWKPVHQRVSFRSHLFSLNGSF